MKKIVYILFFAIITCFISCDETAELDSQLDGFYKIEATFIYPYRGEANYHMLLDGDTIKNGVGYVSRSSTSVTLYVFEKGKTEAELSQEIMLTGNGRIAIQLIKLTGKTVDIYDTDKYALAKLNMVYAQEEDPSLYTLSFNGMGIENNKDFYVRTDQLTGTLEIKKEDEIVYSQEITLEPGITQNYLQISATEYASLPIEDLPAPADKQCYVRFFFFPIDVNGANQLELTTYYLLNDKVSVEKVETLILNPGAITKYCLYDFASVSSDGQRKRSFVYDLKNVETGEILADHTNGDQSNDIGRGTDFKFGTAQIKDIGKSITVPIREQ